jgi:hypothetical protein
MGLDNFLETSIFIPETYDEQLDDLLVRICQKLQLSESQHDLAVQRYNSVGKWLSDSESILFPFSPTIYAQGSIGIGTTVRPMKYQEFDVDLVCQMNIDYANTNPIYVLNMIEYRLKENSIYRDMIERKKRCIRLNYANEFHMDILPAAPRKFDNNGKLKVPDRKLMEWKDSNPKGFMEWFDECAKLFMVMAKASFAEANVEPAPSYEPLSIKYPLKRAIQLMKRYRDVYFKSDDNNAPISIVLTTLAGITYDGHRSVNKTLQHSLKEILRLLPMRGRLIVLNPTNTDEDLSEKWDNDNGSYEKFVSWATQFSLLWDKVNEAKGMHNVASILAEMFGVGVTNESLEDQTELIECARKERQLASSAKTGLLSAAIGPNSIRIKKNTFYGA